MSKPTRTRAEMAWHGMRRRCYWMLHDDFDNYGGRGIVVCDRWLHSIYNFLVDMGECPEGHSLDRIDNDGPYSPENCHWAKTIQQHNNKRTNRYLTHNGHTFTVSEWSRILGVRRATLNARLLVGWSVKDTLTIETTTRGKKRKRID